MGLTQSRTDFIDVLKGIAIISIVQCHIDWVLPLSKFPFGDFTCTFHIMSFVFAAGYFTGSLDTRDELYKALGKRLAKLWYLYMAYSVVFLLLNPLFVQVNILPEEGRMRILKGMLSAVSFANEQSLLYPFWFVPMFLIGSCLFTAAFYFSQKQRFPVPVHIFVILLTALMGIYAHKQELYPMHHSSVSLLSVPVMYLGYIFCRFRDRLDRFVTWWGAFIAAALILFIIRLDVGRMDLSSFMIMSPALFYPVTILALYMAVGFSKGLCKIPYLSAVLSYAGRNSFHIMALHLLAFKLVDIVYGHIIRADSSVISVNPTAFDLRGLYLIAGLAFPALVLFVGRKIISTLEKSSLGVK